MDIDEERVYELILPREMTDEQVRGLMSRVNLRFFTLHEVEIHE